MSAIALPSSIIFISTFLKFFTPKERAQETTDKWLRKEKLG
jgi:hypothetical protein